MTSKNQILLINNTAGGRQALYLNDKLIIQNNPMPTFEITDTMTNNQPFDFNELEVEEEWLEKESRYPELFSEIPKNVFTSN